MTLVYLSPVKGASDFLHNTCVDALTQGEEPIYRESRNSCESGNPVDASSSVLSRPRVIADLQIQCGESVGSLAFCLLGNYDSGPPCSEVTF